MWFRVSTQLAAMPQFAFADGLGTERVQILRNDRTREDGGLVEAKLCTRAGRPDGDGDVHSY